MDLGALPYLVSPAGRGLLAEVEAAYDSHDSLQLSTKLRARHEGPHIAAALTQVELRRRAGDKFGPDAAAMFFTRDGLEQATHRVVAAHRAARAVANGARRLLDLGCGIGADLIAFSRAGLEVSAVDSDPLTAHLAAANLEALGLTGTVAVGRAESQDRSSVDLVYADPARRGARGRVFDPDSYSPPWSFVETLLRGTVDGNPGIAAAGADAVVKAAPGLAYEHIPGGVEAEWVSLDGQLREVVLWSGRLAGAARRATVLSSRGGSSSLTDADDPGPAGARPIGRFVYEPDDAVIRAHLVTAVAARLDGWLVDEHLAYLSSDQLDVGPFARAYEVVDILPFKEKALRAALRARDVGPLTIKKRGVMVTPERLRARLNLSGGTAATIILTRTPTGSVALLVRPRLA